ncbi:hypothetical protein G4V62_07830 [Bacillaceae bacterium SIJ1]|uniref:hypothetical protein n=1 Tax=Litoribacterium kuwaitense TaxID=1398745 RepID=UPI0013ED4958|nr:hypothetical protein [Litoribacterium kuwaitense]NGP44870.1 hypothetical protein [Litoribacterium kuwaitense]
MSIWELFCTKNKYKKSNFSTLKLRNWSSSLLRNRALVFNKVSTYYFSKIDYDVSVKGVERRLIQLMDIRKPTDLELNKILALSPKAVFDGTLGEVKPTDEKIEQLVQPLIYNGSSDSYHGSAVIKKDLNRIFSNWPI